MRKETILPQISGLPQKIWSRLDGIEQREQQKEAIKALGSGDGSEASDEPYSRPGQLPWQS